MANAKILTPVRFTAASYALRVSRNGTPSTLTLNVTAGRDYWLSGDAQADDATGAGDLLALLEALLDTVASGVTVALNAAHQVVVTAPSGTLALLWADGATTLDPAVFGFADADTSAALVVTGTLQAAGIWRPEKPLGPGRTTPVHVAGLARSLAGDVAGAYFGEAYPEREVTFPAVTDAKVRASQAPAGEPLGTLETAWASMVQGRPWRLYEDETSQAYAVHKATSQALPWSPHPRHPWYWQATIPTVELSTWAP